MHVSYSKRAVASPRRLRPVTQGLVGGGAIDLVYFAMDSATEHASAALAALPDLKSMPVNDRIVFGVWTRLEWLARYRLQWAQVRTRISMTQ